ncbi:hypothetical protein PRIPAC_79376 [Pristionchus pacificus]|uniref:Cytochrome P450 n=1 Tax=Pristionchus pacificus TaxID=54126 RepID=A0A2A6C384_PRIPA|nr:hypothetical protein PRIPAC_79376 [Pristionchus pacificus]|eukprot:PDM72579.1 cytochrome P450 [Pristionchus pacificus]
MIDIIYAVGVGIALVLAYYVYDSQYWTRRGIVQVPGKLFLGAARSVLKLKEPRILVLRDWTKKYGKTYGFKEGTKNVLVTSDVDIVNEVFVKQFDNFYGRKSGILSPDPDKDLQVHLFQSRGPRWKRLRALSVPTFSIASLKKIKGIVEDSAIAMVDIMEKRHGDGSRFNIHQFFCEFTMDTISKLVIGQKESALFENDRVKIVQSMFLRDFDHPVVLSAFAFPFLIPLIKAVLYRLDTDITRASRKLRSEIISAVTNRMKEREEKPEMIGYPQNMLDMFLDASVEGEDIEQHTGFKLSEAKINKSLSFDEVAMQVVVFILAGFDTTSNGLAYTAWFLANHPEVQRKCQEEIDAYCQDERIDYEDLNHLKYVEATCKEVLRLVPMGAISNSRTCMNDTTVCGIDIEKVVLHVIWYNRNCEIKDTWIEVDAFSLHVDKSIWGEDADEFKPERWLDPNFKIPQIAYAAFGAGPRICIGMRLGIMEEKLALAHLLRRFTIEKATDDKELRMHGALILTPLDVPVRIVPRT